MSQTYVLNANGRERSQVLANVHTFVDRLPASKSWRVEIKEAKKQRSDPQNHALFGVAYEAINRATGFTKDELHEAFCKRYFGTVEREVMGQVVTRPYRTTTTNDRGERDVMSTEAFAEFYTMVQIVGAEAGIDVPDPDPFWREGRMAA